jgi:hypothetical protein
VTARAGEGDPSTALFTSFTRMAAQAAGKKTAIDLQARIGTDHYMHSFERVLETAKPWHGEEA